MLPLPNSEDLPELNVNPIFYWNHAGMEMNRVTHSVMGPQGGPTMSSRALGLLHLAIHDAYFAVKYPAGAGNPNPAWTPYLSNAIPSALPALGGANNPARAMAGAAVTVLRQLYAPGGLPRAAARTLRRHLSALVDGSPTPINRRSRSHRFGVRVANAVLRRLAVMPGEPGADQLDYEPKTGRFLFRDEPTHPVRLRPVDANDPDGPKEAFQVYHGPFYGTSVATFAAIGDFKLADPPRDYVGADAGAQKARYCEAVDQVIKLGGAPGLASTIRTPDQTVAGYYWAYDGVNLIGTPPRLYNQVLRIVASDQRTAGGGGPVAPATPLTPAETDDIVRLFALANAAMADAGKFCWAEKYHFEFWRPLTGVREHDRASGPSDPDNPPKPGAVAPCADPDPPAPVAGAPILPGVSVDPLADPFWLTLGAPETNTHKINFKPPFPAYPSGHATFGAAAFQIARRFYWKRAADAGGPAEPADKRSRDAFAFTFVSDELNGVSRDLDQPYDSDAEIEDQPGNVRTRVERRFESLWDAIIENAFSRIYLGVHWNFDAFLLRADGTFETGDRTDWPDGAVVENDLPIGGVPLGLAIADSIFEGGLTPPPAAADEAFRAAVAPPAARDEGEDDVDVKLSNTHVTQ